MLKTWVLQLVAKAGVKMSGPAGWLASLFIDKLLALIYKKAVEFFEYLKVKYEGKKRIKLKEKLEEAGNESDEAHDEAFDSLVKSSSNKRV